MSEFSTSFVTNAQNFDVVSLGDAVTDEFIRLPQSTVRRRVDDEGEWLEVPLGTKVVIEDDVTPTTAGGAANSAVALARLDLRVGLASYLAHDQIGLDMLSAMHGENVGTSVVHVDSPAHTVRNFVLSYGSQRTVLVRAAGFNYHWTGLREHEMPAWLYINSLGPDALNYQDEIADWLDQHPEVRVAFFPGIFQLEAGAQRLARLYAKSELLVCADRAATTLTGISMDRADEALDGLLQLGARCVVVVDESGGAMAATHDERLRISPFPDPRPARDITGVADAFAATMVSARVRGVSLGEALRWASLNASSVARQLGTQAGLLRLSDLLDGLRAAPADFVARPWS